MKWLGNLSAFLLLQVALVLGLYHYRIGAFPQNELYSIWTGCWYGVAPESKEEVAKKAKKAAQSQAVPSYEELLRSRTLEAKEIERQRQEAESLYQLAQSRQNAVDEARKSLLKIRQELEKDFETEKEQLAKEGRQKVLALLEVMQPRQVADFLRDSTDEKSVLAIIGELDPVVAAKVFKEFPQPAPGEQGKLNDWLEKLGQGEPGASALQDLQAKLPQQ